MNRRQFVKAGIGGAAGDVVEDQLTYPVVTAMLGTPRVKDVCGFSEFGYSW